MQGSPTFLNAVKFLPFLCLLLFLSGLSAQDITTPDFRKNAIHVELGGAGLLYSLNYERTLSKNFLIKTGFTALYGEHLLFPVSFGKYFGRGTHHVEIGLGVTNTFFNLNSGKDEIEFILLGNGFAGYRVQRINGRSIFRVGFSPFFTLYSSYADNKNIFMPWAAISYGYRF